jgi:serine phosphatase RsbU (regulator of sigma subunit)
MTDVRSLLELAFRSQREGSAPLPTAVLDGLLRGAEASGGALGRGDQVLARLGSGQVAHRRHEIPGWREAFWLELADGQEPPELLRIAAGVVLGSWAAREELKQARFAERRGLWEVESLRAIAEALGGTLEPARIAEELLLHATALLDARRGEVWLLASEQPSRSAHLAGGGATALCESGECVTAARVGGAVLTVEEAATLPDHGLVEPGRLAVPVVGRRGRLGVLALAEREVRGGTAPFAATDGETLALYASQAAVALENATLHREALEQERTERELQLAAAIQQQLLPTAIPSPPGFDIAARSLPSRRVGGDVYDFITTPDGLFFMLGDVAGKGVPAALMAASLQAAVRLLVQGSPDLSQLTQKLHQHLLASTPDSKFATVFMGTLRSGGEVEWVSAGHNPVVLVSATGRCEYLNAVGPPLGLLPDVSYPSRTAVLEPGAVLLAYTDGLSEAPAPGDDGPDFGLAGIAKLAVERRGEPMERLVAGLFDAVEAHTGGAPPHDDRTVLAVRRAPA